MTDPRRRPHRGDALGEDTPRRSSDSRAQVDAVTSAGKEIGAGLRAVAAAIDRLAAKLPDPAPRRPPITGGMPGDEEQPLVSKPFLSHRPPQQQPPPTG